MIDKQHLYNQYHSLSFKGRVNGDPYIDNLNNIVASLVQVGAVFDDEPKIHVLLQDLPPQYAARFGKSLNMTTTLSM